MWLKCLSLVRRKEEEREFPSPHRILVAVVVVVAGVTAVES